MGKTLFCFPLIISLLVVFSGKASALEKPVVAVFDIETQLVKLSAPVLNGMSDYLASLLAESGVFQVVPRSELKKRLLNQKAESYKNCYEQTCQIALGRELAAGKSLSTQIFRLGGGCKLSMSLFDLKRAATEAATTTSGQCDEKGLVSLLDVAVKQLVRKLDPNTKKSSNYLPAAVAAEGNRTNDDVTDTDITAEHKIKQGVSEEALKSGKYAVDIISVELHSGVGTDIDEGQEGMTSAPVLPTWGAALRMLTYKWKYYRWTMLCGAGGATFKEAAHNYWYVTTDPAFNLFLDWFDHHQLTLGLGIGVGVFKVKDYYNNYLENVAFVMTPGLRYIYRFEAGFSVGGGFQAAMFFPGNHNNISVVNSFLLSVSF